MNEEEVKIPRGRAAGRNAVNTPLFHRSRPPVTTACPPQATPVNGADIPPAHKLRDYCIAQRRTLEVTN